MGVVTGATVKEPLAHPDVLPSPRARTRQLFLPGTSVPVGTALMLVVVVLYSGVVYAEALSTCTSYACGLPDR